MWFDFFFGSTVTRDQLGQLPAGPWSDRFRPPPYDPVADIRQGGTGQQLTSHNTHKVGIDARTL